MLHAGNKAFGKSGEDGNMPGIVLSRPEIGCQKNNQNGY